MVSSGSPRRSGSRLPPCSRQWPPNPRSSDASPRSLLGEVGPVVLLFDRESLVNWRFELPYLEDEVRADLTARLAGGTAGPELGVAVAAGVACVCRHGQHARTAGVDAQVTALACFDVDDDRAPRADRHGARACVR